MKVKRILVVDDDHEFLRALTLRLQANRYEVMQAVDADSATELARRESPDLIVLDLGLPRGDGFLAIQRLKSFPSTGSIPIVVLTAKDAEKNQERAYEGAAADFLQKPVNNEWLPGGDPERLGLHPACGAFAKRILTQKARLFHRLG